MSRPCQGSPSWIASTATLDTAAIENAGAVSKQVALCEFGLAGSKHLKPTEGRTVIGLRHCSPAGSSAICPFTNRLSTCGWSKDCSFQLALRKKPRGNLCPQVYPDVTTPAASVRDPWWNILKLLYLLNHASLCFSDPLIVYKWAATWLQGWRYR